MTTKEHGDAILKAIDKLNELTRRLAISKSGKQKTQLRKDICMLAKDIYIMGYDACKGGLL